MRMSRISKANARASAAGFLLAACALAHDTWIRPASARIEPGAVLRVSMTSGGAFPEPESPIDPARIRRAEVLERGSPKAIASRKRRARTLELAIRFDTPGVATVAVSLAPRTLTLEASKIGEYLDEIDARETAGAIWSATPEPRRWRESYTKHAKTHARVGDAAGDDSWRKPVGLALEIVAEKDPTALSAGDSLPVHVLRDGRPLAGFSLRADPGPGGKTLRRTTDADGRAVFVLDRAGPWLLAGTDLRRDAEAKLWRSDFTTLTVEVAAEASR
jgi:uncharacterized GH25 family protein